jgi:hypothetical protein
MRHGNDGFPVDRGPYSTFQREGIPASAFRPETLGARHLDMPFHPKWLSSINTSTYDP